MPEVAALIYRCKFKDGVVKKDLSLDYTGNYCSMMGYDDKAFQDLMRLYLVIHSVRLGLISFTSCFFRELLVLGSADSDNLLALNSLTSCSRSPPLLCM